MNTMVKAPPEPGTCPATACRRDEVDLTHPTRRHGMQGSRHLWVGEHTTIVMDCRDGSKSVHENGEMLAFETAVSS